MSLVAVVVFVVLICLIAASFVGRRDFSLSDLRSCVMRVTVRAGRQSTHIVVDTQRTHDTTRRLHTLSLAVAKR